MHNDEDDERAEEYYNCGYDGIYIPKEKAIIFECVGRGAKLLPLSKIRLPSFVVERIQNHPEDVRPSHHVLQLLSPAVTSSQEPNANRQQTNMPQSSEKDLPQSNKSNNGICSESSDLDVYISDEDGANDECDSHLPITNIPVQNFVEKKLFLPTSMVCNTVCSSSGNRVALCETDASRNEKDDSTTSDDEVFSNPSFGDDSGSDNEEVSVSTNNLSHPVSYNKVDEDNPANNLNSARSVQNIPLDENLSVANSASLKVSDSFQQTSSISEHQALPICHDRNSTVEKVCSERSRNSEIDGRPASSSSNSYTDPVAEMFSSSESEEDFYVTHFRTNMGETKLSVESPVEFPQLPQKQVQNRQNKHKVANLPPSQLKIKNIAQMLLSSPTETVASEKNVNVKTNKKEKDSKTKDLGLLVIDNLPQNINKGCLANFLQQFGEIQDITLIPFPDKMIARIKIDADLDWIISCLDGSDAFSADSHIVRCYQE